MKFIYIIAITALLLSSSIGYAQINTFEGNIIQAPGPGCATGNESPNSPNASFENEVIVLINQLRQQNGLPPLKKTTSLVRAARYHADDMCTKNYFSHPSQDGNGNEICAPFDRVGNFYTWTAAGENICAGYPTAQAAFQGWSNSQGHYNNMVSPNFYEFGVGYDNSPTATYGTRWVTNFGRRTGVYPIIINNEEINTASTNVQLYLYGNGILSQVRLKTNNGAWSNWMPFSSQMSYTLEGINQSESVTVTAEMKNAAGTLTVTSSDDINLTLPSFTLVKAKAILQGSYNPTTDLMSTALANAGLLPLTQPFSGSPWNYNGSEVLSSLPADMTDWILVEVRDPNDNNTILEQKAAILRSNGDIVDIDGISDGVKFYDITAGSYYISIKSRNHLALLSANAENLTANNTCDFTQNNMAFGGNSQITIVGNNKCALKAGDTDSNGIITVSDFNFMQSNMSAINVYSDADCNLDRNVTVADFNLYSGNISSIAIPQLRY